MKQQVITGIPSDVLAFVRTHSNKNGICRFPQKLWKLLHWAGDNKQRLQVSGCGWLSDTVFIMNKELLSEVMAIKLNTLNVNLKNLGFEQVSNRNGSYTFWTHRSFRRDSMESTHEVRISNTRIQPTSAYFLPILDSIILYGMDEMEVNAFKVSILSLWTTIVAHKFILAISSDDFVNSLMAAFESNLGLFFQDTYPLTQVLASEIDGVVSFLEFAVLMARFGPLETLFAKITQYQEAIRDLCYEIQQPKECFSPTYVNCFRFAMPNRGESHYYNLPLNCVSKPFLIDEEKNVYDSWQQLSQINGGMLAENLL